MIYDNVLQAMGHTPLVRLNRLSEANAAQILVKFEGVNVGGSIKTRTALQMIESAERRGEIGPDSIIVEPTSGNQESAYPNASLWLSVWLARILVFTCHSSSRTGIIY